MADTQQTVLAGRYRLVDQLGRGGMGTVWRAHDELLGRDVAVKEVLLPPGVDDDTRDDLLERTKREARAAARLSHPNVVTVFDVVEVGGRPWIVMELVKARGLNQIVRDEGPLPPERVASIGVQLLNALGVAHASGIFHRDVKPSNVLVADNGRVVLADFGIASVQGDPAMTRSGLILGSPSYIAPERARGLPAGSASDLWAVGATLYTAVEGRPPYDRDGIVPILTAAAMEDPDPFQLAGPLAPVLTALLHREPAKRPAADEARLALRKIALLGAPTAPERTRAAGPAATAVLPAADPGAPAPRTPPEAPVSPSTDPPAGDTGADEPVAAFGAEPAVRPVSPATPRRADIPMQAAPPAAPPAATPSGTDAPRRRRTLALAAALVIAVLVMVGTLIALTNGDDDPSAPVASSTPSGRTSATTSPSDAAVAPSNGAITAPNTGTSPTPTTGTGSAATPVGWHQYTGPGGFSIGVPDGWSVQPDGTSVRIQDNRGLFLLIQQSNQPKADAKADWLQQEPARRARSNGYERIRIDTITYRDYLTAADWEFYFNRGGTRLHVLNRGFVTSRTQAYGFYWETPTDKWAAGQPYFQTFATTFQPAS